MKTSIESGAKFSTDKKYRYALWRIWDKTKPLAMFVGFNPSVADDKEDDQTIKRIISISKHNNYGGFYIVNLYAIVSSDADVVSGKYH